MEERLVRTLEGLGRDMADLREALRAHGTRKENPAPKETLTTSDKSSSSTDSKLTSPARQNPNVNKFCERCCRRGHVLRQCHAKKDINGKPLKG